MGSMAELTGHPAGSRGSGGGDDGRLSASPPIPGESASRANPASFSVSGEDKFARLAAVSTESSRDQGPDTQRGPITSRKPNVIKRSVSLTYSTLSVNERDTNVKRHSGGFLTVDHPQPRVGSRTPTPPLRPSSSGTSPKRKSGGSASTRQAKIGGGSDWSGDRSDSDSSGSGSNKEESGEEREDETIKVSKLLPAGFRLSAFADGRPLSAIRLAPEGKGAVEGEGSPQVESLSPDDVVEGTTTDAPAIDSPPITPITPSRPQNITSTPCTILNSYGTASPLVSRIQGSSPRVPRRESLQRFHSAPALAEPSEYPTGEVLIRASMTLESQMGEMNDVFQGNERGQRLSRQGSIVSANGTQDVLADLPPSSFQHRAPPFAPNRPPSTRPRSSSRSQTMPLPPVPSMPSGLVGSSAVPHSATASSREIIHIHSNLVPSASAPLSSNFPVNPETFPLPPSKPGSVSSRSLRNKSSVASLASVSESERGPGGPKSSGSNMVVRRERSSSSGSSVGGFRPSRAPSFSSMSMSPFHSLPPTSSPSPILDATLLPAPISSSPGHVGQPSGPVHPEGGIRSSSSPHYHSRMEVISDPFGFGQSDQSPANSPSQSHGNGNHRSHRQRTSHASYADGPVAPHLSPPTSNGAPSISPSLASSGFPSYNSYSESSSSRNSSAWTPATTDMSASGVRNSRLSGSTSFSDTGEGFVSAKGSKGSLREKWYDSPEVINDTAAPSASGSLSDGYGLSSANESEGTQREIRGESMSPSRPANGRNHTIPGADKPFIHRRISQAASEAAFSESDFEPSESESEPDPDTDHDPADFEPISPSKLVGLGLSTEDETDANEQGHDGRSRVKSTYVRRSSRTTLEQYSRFRSGSNAGSVNSGWDGRNWIEGTAADLSFLDLDQESIESRSEVSRPHAAVVIAEAGKGTIIDTKIRSHEESALDNFNVPDNTTHLLLSDSDSPLLPILLRDILPDISDSLLVLDISSCNLTDLPATISTLHCLEELNVSRNPLSTCALPSFVSELHSLRVLIADGCNILSIPWALTPLSSLHTLSLRENELKSLPSWLCRLPALETLLVDGNPFVKQWREIVNPILIQPKRRPQQLQFSGTLPSRPRTAPDTLASGPRTSKALPATPVSPSSSISSFPDSPIDPISHGPRPRLTSVSDAIFRQEPVKFDDDEDPPTENPPKLLASMARNHSVIDMADIMPRSQPMMRRMKSAGDLKGGRPATPGGMSVLENSLPLPFPEQPTSTTTSHFSSASSQSSSSKSASPNDAKGNGGGMGDDDGKGLPIRKWGLRMKASLSKMKVRSKGSMDPDQAEVVKSTLRTQEGRRGLGSGEKPDATSKTYSRILNLTRPRTASSVTTSFRSRPNASTPLHELPLADPEAKAKKDLNRRRSFLRLDDVPILTLPAAEEPDVQPPPLSSFDSPATQKSALKSIMAYLRDLDDLAPDMTTSLPLPDTVGLATPVSSVTGTSSLTPSITPSDSRRTSIKSGPCTPSLSRKSSRLPTPQPSPEVSTDSEPLIAGQPADVPMLKIRDDSTKRDRVLTEILVTERTYVRALRELVEIYVWPAGEPVKPGASGTSTTQTMVPTAERKAVFGNIENLLHFHADVFLPDLEAVSMAYSEQRSSVISSSSAESALLRQKTEAVAGVFIQHAAFLKMYAAYVMNFDFALARLQSWTAPTVSQNSNPSSPGNGAASLVAATQMFTASVGSTIDSGLPSITPSQKKRIKSFLKKCRMHSKHSQINLESYLLLPVQRIPRYKLLLENLVSCTPASRESATSPEGVATPDPIIKEALDLVSQVASDLNERKRDSEGRHRLLHWQNRIGNRFRSPLVQPHRTLLREGSMTMCRIVKRTSNFVELESGSGPAAVLAASGGAPVVQIHTLQTAVETKRIMALLCNDILVLTLDRRQKSGPVELFTVLRLGQSYGTTQPPASVFGAGDMLRIVDSRAILYLRVPSPAEATVWAEAINLQMSL